VATQRVAPGFEPIAEAVAETLETLPEIRPLHDEHEAAVRSSREAERLTARVRLQDRVRVDHASSP
jgi:hypothetical protein